MFRDRDREREIERDRERGRHRVEEVPRVISRRQVRVVSANQGGSDCPFSLKVANHEGKTIRLQTKGLRRSVSPQKFTNLHRGPRTSTWE